MISLSFPTAKAGTDAGKGQRSGNPNVRHIRPDPALSWILVLVCSVFPPSGHGGEWQWREKLTFHGFLSQGFSWTSDNNFFGHSEDGSFNYSEIGLNGRLTATSWLSVAAQGIYRHAGNVENKVQLDYALADFLLYTGRHFNLHLRGGRIKNPYGLYNETRDVAFTRPSIILPQGIYFNRSRALYLSSDGGQFFAIYDNGPHEWSFTFNAGLPRRDFAELEFSIFGFNPPGKLEPNRPMYLGQIRYEYDAGKVIFALGYGDIELEYNATANDPVTVMLSEAPFKSGTFHTRPLIFSLQFNGESFTLTGEYLIQFNKASNFGPGLNRSLTSESWYVQGQYRILSSLQILLRYDAYFLDRSHRNGKDLDMIPIRPRHATFAKDWTAGLRWDITPRWMAAIEYHNVNGTAWLPFKDNQNPLKTERRWNMVLGLISFRF